MRPIGKSGGHGTGWSEITPYRFVTYEGWEEKPVSIADPEGTEIDAKFASEQDGELKIILAPILRFADFPAEVRKFREYSVYRGMTLSLIHI